MTIQQQVRYWMFALLVLLALVWLLSSILLPFVAGMAVAALVTHGFGGTI